ncbi:hypothetical protein SAMN05444166_7337 [Singulisphaera sp. GP187]|uniref:hypothetical protein n=1 Tax=Singulisphaera sp. GP187 TaxID=1882752 RepID=UPI000927C475|nr:hypothetical protein [Singulisphaera sp. GP187]SIO63406.1 hypothetical protein SAMN05444166_7337 [Singulisphaera sp. GP187]
MSDLDLTLGTQRRPDTGEVILSTTEETLTELSRTIAAALLARGRVHFVRDELDFALADLDAALAQDPLDAEAIVLRSQVHLKRADHYLAYKDIDAALRINEYNLEAIHTRGLLYQSTGRLEQAELDFRVARAKYWSPPTGIERTHLAAGLHVVASFKASPSTPDVLLVTYSLDRLCEAVAEADRYGYSPEDRQRLADDGFVDHPSFDAVVYEVRSVRRGVASYEPLDDQGNFIDVDAVSSHP